MTPTTTHLHYCKMALLKHDARILSVSGLRVIFENGHIPIYTHLLGDSGYPSRRWLLTLFKMPLHGPQTNYNGYV